MIKLSRLTVKRFGLFASASLLAVVTAIGLLQISAPTQAHTAQIAQAQPAKPASSDAVLDWNAIAQTATLAASAPPPQQCSYTSFSQIAKELGESRIWAGVHTRTADNQGDVLGKQVGDYVFQNALQSLKS
jgi:hypothetical protein